MGKNENQQDIFLSSLRKSLFYFCAVSIICIALFLVNVIFFNEPISDWGAYGDYIGGVIGTIFAIAAFIGTLIMIHIQQKELTETKEEFKIQSKIFNQQQFEETFFDMLKMIDDKQNKYEYVTRYMPTPVEHQDFFMINPLLIEIIKNIDNYKKNYETKHKESFPEDDYKKYVNILKLQLNNSTICEFIFKIKSDNDEKRKEYCENYQFFEFIKDIYIDDEDTLLFYDFSAFGDNKIYQQKISNFTKLKEEHFQKLLQYNVREVLLNLAKNSNSSDWVLEKLAQNEDINIRLNVANNRNAPEKALEILSQKDNEENIRKAVAAHKNTSENILNKLSTDKNHLVRKTVAQNLRTTIDTLDNLSKDENDEVCFEVIKNQNTSPNALNYLSKNGSFRLRLEVAKDKKTSPETLDYLSKDKGKDIRLEVVKNQNISSDTLNYLSKDEKYEIRLEVAKNNHTPKNTLAYLANAENSGEDIKTEVAKNTNTSEQTLLELSKMKGRYWYSVIKNPATTTEILKELYSNILEKERHIYLLENEKTPLYIMEKIILGEWNKDKNNNIIEWIPVDNELLINSKSGVILNIIKEIIKENDYSKTDNVVFSNIVQQFNQENRENLIIFIKEEIRKDNTSIYDALYRLIENSNNLFSEQDFIDMENGISKYQYEKRYDSKRNFLLSIISKKLRSL